MEDVRSALRCSGDTLWADVEEVDDTTRKRFTDAATKLFGKRFQNTEVTK